MFTHRINPGKQNGKGDQAIALGYDAESDIAPRVLATGRGAVAERILEIARQNNIPIQQDPVLTAALATLDVDELVPPELYTVLAELFAYIYKVRQRRMGG